MLTLILSQPDTTGSFAIPLTAVFALTGVPTHVEYARAATFDIYRNSDNARFEWTEVEPLKPAGGGLPFRPTSGNYLLADSANSRGLGRADLRPGETYQLRISYAGRVIEGTTRMPDEPRPRVVNSQGGLRVVWPRVPGVTLYYVLGASVTQANVPYSRFTTDTVAIPTLIDGLSTTVHVLAVDSNYARFLSDTLNTSSGLTGARGVFGAVSVGHVMVR